MPYAYGKWYTTEYMKVRHGFTLVEVLVVVAVLIIIALITTTTYEGLQKKSNDQAHQADVATISEALEDYYDKNGEYPYANDLNTNPPSQNSLSSYNNTLAILKSLKSDSLDGPSNYTFMPIPDCTGQPTSCTMTPAGRALKPSQIIYMTALKGNNGQTYWQFNSTGNLWGCKVNFYDTTPAAVLAWRSEVTGKWTFLKSRHGNATIENFDSGPVAPTVCQFTQS